MTVTRHVINGIVGLWVAGYPASTVSLTYDCGIGPPSGGNSTEGQHDHFFIGLFARGSHTGNPSRCEVKACASVNDCGPYEQEIPLSCYSFSPGDGCPQDVYHTEAP